MNKSLSVTKTVAVFAAASFLIAGCASPKESDNPSPSSVAIETQENQVASEPVPTESDFNSQTQMQQPFQDYQNLLDVESSVVKAGDYLRVFGGTLTPGTEVKIYAAQLIEIPPYDPESNTQQQAGEETKLTDTVSAIIDSNGIYDVQLPIPAGMTAQTVNIIMLSSDGRSSGIQVSIE